MRNGLVKEQEQFYGLAGPRIGVKTKAGGSGSSEPGPSAGGPSSGISLKSLKSFASRDPLSSLPTRSLTSAEEFAATRFSRFSFPNAAISATENAEPGSVGVHFSR